MTGGAAMPRHPVCPAVVHSAYHARYPDIFQEDSK